VRFKAPMYEPTPLRRKGRGPLLGLSVRTRGICSSIHPFALVEGSVGSAFLLSVGSAFSPLARLWASGETNLQQTNSLVWVMIAISAAGAIVTFAFLVYSLWRFRDPKVKGRRYG